MLPPNRVIAVVSLVLLGLLASAAPASAAGGSKVANGRAADPGEYPFMVSLQTPDGSHFCGGSIIAPEWVLTAAHCLTDFEGGPASPSDIVVRVGAHDVKPPGVDGTSVAVTEVVVHPDYFTNGLDDIGLLRLASAQSAAPIAMADAGDAALEAPGVTATLTGWGSIDTYRPEEDRTFVEPETLQEVEMPILPDSECSGPGFEGNDPARYLCAGAPEDDEDGGIDAGPGDSGGPLFAIDGGGTRVQVGLVSGGPSTGYTPSTYTQVSAYTSFIAAVLADRAPTEFPENAERVAGANRYATAAALAARGWSAPIDQLFLVTGQSFADALSVAPLAHLRDAPVLLTDTATLPTETADMIRSLRPTSVVIVGGPGAVSQTVADQVQQITGSAPSRVAGASRYDTAAELSRRSTPDALPDSFPSVFLASGESFADALGGAAAAAADPSTPLLLTPRGALPQATADEITRLAPERVYLLGGTSAVSTAVEEAVVALGTTVVRIAGQDRYETSAMLAETIFGGPLDAVIASGTSFPDGLVAGALGQALLLVPPPGNQVPASVLAVVDVLDVQRLTVMGGTGAVSDAAAAQVGAAR